MKRYLVGLLILMFHLGSRGVRSFDDSAARDIRAKLKGEHTKVVVGAHSNGLFGEIFGDLSSVEIRASQFEVDGLPFHTEPTFSRKGVIRTLRLEMDDCVLSGLAVKHLEAAIPDCRFDFSAALRERKIRLTQSGVGPGKVVVTADGLATFLRKKYPGIDRLTVRIETGQALVDGHGRFGVFVADFAVAGDVGVLDGAKLVIQNATLTMDGKPASPALTKAAIALFNPVLDLNKDLKLEGAVEARSVELRRGEMVATALVHIPEAQNRH